MKKENCRCSAPDELNEPVRRISDQEMLHH